jgi:preprotein translocase subunit SecY
MPTSASSEQICTQTSVEAIILACIPNRPPIVFFRKNSLFNIITVITAVFAYSPVYSAVLFAIKYKHTSWSKDHKSARIPNACSSNSGYREVWNTDNPLDLFLGRIINYIRWISGCYVSSVWQMML